MFRWKFLLMDEANDGGDAGGGGKESDPPSDENNTEKDEKGGVEEPSDPPSDNKDEKSEKNDKDGVDSPPDYTLALEKDSLLSEADLKRVSEFAKSRKLSEADAKELLLQEEDAKGDLQEAAEAAHKEKTDGWKKEIEGRKEYKAEVESVDAALKEFGSEELTKHLEETGYRNWQPLWDTLKKVGDAMKDDTFEWGGKPPGGDKPKTLGEQWYPEETKKLKAQ